MADEVKTTGQVVKQAMDFRDPSAPIWPIVRLVVVGSLLMSFLALGYYNKFSNQDWITWSGIVTALGGIDTIKTFIATGSSAAEKKN